MTVKDLFNIIGHDPWEDEDADDFSDKTYYLHSFLKEEVIELWFTKSTNNNYINVNFNTNNSENNGIGIKLRK